MEEPQLSQSSLSSLDARAEIEQPVTPEPPHASLPAATTAAVAGLQAKRVDKATSQMTPPPSTQVPSSQHAKTRTPTPPISHISTPPPTIEVPSQNPAARLAHGYAGSMSSEQIASASVEELRSKVSDLQSALQEAKMSAAHHKLQYQMLSQESAAAIERMAVEARMAQYENEVIHVAERKAAATPVQPSTFLEGMIPVQKDLYQRMCGEIHQLTEERNYLADEQAQAEKIMMRQDFEIASLSDKVYLMRERIRENRQQLNRYRKSQHPSRVDSTPRSLYNDPMRSGVSSQEEPQPFAALLQASEMASQEARRPVKKAHARNTHSMSSLPTTPAHSQKHPSSLYYTPHNRQTQTKVPSTAPLPRMSAMRTPDVYSQQSLPVSHYERALSEGTVSAPEDDDDSEAETEIIEQDEISESQASRAASQMLRSSQEQQAKRDSFKGSGMLPQQQNGAKLKQTKLAGQVRKAHVEREDERPAKRARVSHGVGLGIAGVRD